jgi:hypothetical protein
MKRDLGGGADEPMRAELAEARPVPLKRRPRTPSNLHLRAVTILTRPALTGACDEREKSWEDEGAMAGTGERPTLHPAFDMEEYARESDERIRSAGPSSGAVSTAEVLVEASDEIGDEEQEQVYWACVGGGDRVPLLVQPLDQLLVVPRSPVESFVLSYLDGRRSVADVIEASGLPTLVGLIAVHDLLERGLITLQDAR